MLNLIHWLFRRSLLLNGLAGRVKYKFDTAWRRFIKAYTLGLSGFRAFDLTFSFAANIPALEDHLNCDVNGDLTMFIPDLMADPEFLVSSVRLRKEVLSEAEELCHVYRSRCCPRRLLGVHIRRGDYVIHSSLNLDAEYYAAALRLFPPSEWSLLVFSDDIAYCKAPPFFGLSS